MYISEKTLFNFSCFNNTYNYGRTAERRRCDQLKIPHCKTFYIAREFGKVEHFQKGYESFNLRVILCNIFIFISILLHQQRDKNLLIKN